ncbi:MAG: hypothetical protein MRK01_08075 [Candidatus Scalindua sp.]|nr:hypothetical protein [Candidatus Scalindua sp.]
MKRPEVLRILSVGILVTLLVVGVSEKVYSAQKVYDFKSAEIEMRTVDPMSNVTTETVRIDNWGEYESRHSSSTIKMMGMEQKHESITYTDRNENVVYNYDPKMNQATKVDITKALEGMNKGNKEYVYSEEALKKWGGTKLRSEEFLGLQCDVIEFSQFFTTVWFHKKFPVKSETNMGAMKVKTEAVRFKEGVSFAKKDITLPEGVKIVDAPDIGNIMGQINAQKKMPGNRGDAEGSDSQPNNEFDPEEMPDFGEMPNREKAMEAFESMRKMFRNLEK